MVGDVSRRTFLKTTAATAALGAVGVTSMAAWQAEAAEQQGADVKRMPSMCNGCSNKCGFFATVVDGRLWTIEGNEKHPKSKGTICGRGHGMAQMAYSDERLTQPMRRTAEGEFEPVDWDTALSEIGEKLTGILASDGPEAVCYIHDPRPLGSFYGPRFMNALGVSNIYTHGAACNLSLNAGFSNSLGSGSFSVDLANTKMVVYIGRSFADGITPADVQGIAAAADRSTRIVIVDPRLNNTGIFATDWVPILPGTDLALLLGIANVLIAEDLYDHEFVEKYSVGFEEFAEQAREYTPEWAEGICDVPAETIVSLARDLAAAAPACAIDSSWHAAFGCLYKNSFDTARAVAAVNTLLGAWGQKGGAIMPGSPKLGELDPVKFPAVAKPEVKRVGDAEFPLVPAGMGTNLAALKAALDGRMKAFIFYNSNAAQGYTQPKMWREGLGKAELVVVIDVHMSETAMCAHYVLPECTYLERLEPVEMLGGKKHFCTVRTRVLDRIHPETRSGDEIFSGLAKACGVGDKFDFTIDELVDAQLASIGLTLDRVAEEGVVELEAPEFTYGVPAKFEKPEGKFMFASEKVGAAGLNPVIGFTAREVQPEGEQLSLVAGKQGIHSHTMTQNVAALNAISREYGLERLWMAAADAEARGIADGDLVEVSNDEHTAQVHVRVTERMKPGVLFLPMHYGGTSPYQTRANGYGINIMDFVPFRMEPGVGSAMSHETAVTVRKVEE